MEQPEFKFEPIWTSSLGILSFFLTYKVYNLAFTPDFKSDPGIFIFLLWPILLCSFTLPMLFRMITGIPAILYTTDKLVDNVLGTSIDWENIQEVRMTGARKPFLSIILKDKDLFYSSIGNPFKRYFLKFLFSISPGDVSVNLAFVAGDNESIVAVTQVYWNRFYGRND